MKTWAKVALAGAVLATAAAAFIFLPLSRGLLVFVQWVKAQGPMGVAAFALVYVGATVLMVPGSLLTLGAGFVYGPLWGTLLISPVSVAAATAAFVGGRFFARDFVKRKTAGRPRFAALDEALAEGGVKMVVLIRLSPLFPFNLLNYALGATRVSLGAYVVGSFLGMLPATVLYVYLGSLITHAGALLDAGDSGDARVARNGFYWVGLAATLVVTVVITRAAKRAMNQKIGRMP